MDFGKFKYEQTKKKQEAKRKQRSTQIKEIKVRPKTDDHDLATKVRHIEKFISKNDKVKITLVFRGREFILKKYLTNTCIFETIQISHHSYGATS